MAGEIVIVRGMYVLSGKSAIGPTASQRRSTLSNIGPIAKPSAGSVKAAVAIAPPVWTVAVMNRRRVSVSPANAPGTCSSEVRRGFFDVRSADTGTEIYRPATSGDPREEWLRVRSTGGRDGRHEVPPP